MLVLRRTTSKPSTYVLASVGVYSNVAIIRVLNYATRGHAKAVEKLYLTRLRVIVAGQYCSHLCLVVLGHRRALSLANESESADILKCLTHVIRMRKVAPNAPFSPRSHAFAAKPNSKISPAGYKMRAAGKSVAASLNAGFTVAKSHAIDLETAKMLASRANRTAVSRNLVHTLASTNAMFLPFAKKTSLVSTRSSSHVIVSASNKRPGVERPRVQMATPPRA